MKGSGDTVIPGNTFKGDISSLMFYVMILLVVSMPLSEFGMSVSQFLLLGLWIFEGADFNSPPQGVHKLSNFLSVIGKNLAGKFRMVVKNRILLIVISIYLLHVIGLLYSTDFQYALKDLRIKLPLLSLPILLATSKMLDWDRFQKLMLFLCLAVLAGSIVSIYVKLTRTIIDPREISVFISHIRFALLICFTIFILLFFVIRKVYRRPIINISLILAVIWLITFLFILKSLTGLIICAIIFLTSILIFIFRRKKFLIPGIVVLLLSGVGAWQYIRDVNKELTVAAPVQFSKLDKYTSQGNPYVHDIQHYGIESGKYVGLYISERELKQAWNSRSSLPYNGSDKRGQELRYTLIRYLHSKGYRKDAEGVQKLTDGEVGDIENGVADVDYLKNFNVRAKLEQFLLGYHSYRNSDDPNASSFMQRVEYWKTSIYIISKKPFLGSGTGDLNLAFNKAYDETHSRLEPSYRHRSHNQFLAIGIAFGLIGLIIFVFALIYPPIFLGKFKNYIYLVFFIIVMISMLTEDTLETQAGVTFFAFFNALLLFGVRMEVDKKSFI